MKKIQLILIGVITFAAISCNKYLDINDNPNTAISSTPELVLPQAIVGSGNNTNSNFNFGMGADLMYRANGGGFSGFGTVISYDYTTANFTGIWSTTYDNLNDYRYILESTKGNPRFIYYNAIARIMTAYNYQLLVDTYNDVPYTDALNGVNNISPKYDKGTDIYKDIAAQIDTAIIQINTGLANSLSVLPFNASSDPLFSRGGPNMVRWKQFANTIKLRLIVRAEGKVTFNNTTFSSDGFLVNDALVNPGYAKIINQQSPLWPWTVTNTASASSRLPSTFLLSFYDGTKLRDDRRGTAFFRIYPNSPSNQLGNETNPNPPNGATPNNWFKGTSATVWDRVGIHKGFDAGVPIITAAESFFLQAEAVVKGIIPGSAVNLFNSGIEASFTYLYKDNTDNLPALPPFNAPTADAVAYRVANATNFLANFTLATTNEQRIEAIITQKYIALALISSHEAWNDYRRTGYPRVTGNGPTQTMASTVSLSTRPDKMPTRVLYPASEFNTNQSNVPKDVDKFKSLIFWAK